MHFFSFAFSILRTVFKFLLSGFSMTMNMADSDPDFCFFSSPNFILSNFPSSSSSNPSTAYHQNPRKKRSRFLKVDSGSPPPDSRPVSRPKYGKKPDPGAPKITRPCSECGKKFWSWKALFGHMICHPERQWRGINPPPNYRRPISHVKQTEDVDPLVTITEEDQDIAACLLILSNGDVDVAGEMECGTSYTHGVQESDALGLSSDNLSCRFECSSCKKVFGSHQALGGHRASHKNVKGCFAITRSSGDCSEVEDGCVEIGEGGIMKENYNGEDNKMMMVLGNHKCSICLRLFSSGHKRCHWEKGDEPLLNQGLSTFTSNETSYGGLDLNLLQSKLILLPRILLQPSFLI